MSPQGTGSKSVDLVCEGGGVRGIGLVGAVDALAAAGYRFPRVAGTSAGAIVASLVAALQAAGEPLTPLPKSCAALTTEVPGPQPDRARAA